MSDEQVARLVSDPVQLAESEAGAFGTAGSTDDAFSLQSQESRILTAAGLHAVAGQLVRRVNDDLGLIGVFIAPDPDDVVGGTDPTSWQDIRPADTTQLDLILFIGQAEEVRTVATGSRIDNNLVDNPAHARIRRNSPVRPSTRPGEGLLDREAIDRYTNALGRHPGRRVDVALSAGETEGGVVLDYLVAEAKPWTIFGQVSNTGTESTDELRSAWASSTTSSPVTTTS